MEPTLYMMIGLPGSGKTWYANRLKAVKVSQDEMGGDGHLREFCKCLTNGDSVVVDRVNFDREQRDRYISPARARGYSVVCVWFDADQAACLNRLSDRRGHPTVSESDNHEMILKRYAGLMVFPLEDEYDELNVVSLVDQI